MSIRNRKHIKSESSQNVSNPLHLAEFSHAVLKSNNSVKFQSYTSSEMDKGKSRRLLVASSGRLEYVGSNYETDASKVTSSLLKIGVLNKNTNMFKLYDADIFHLRPFIVCEADTTSSDKSWSEMNEDLALAFGSKTRKRMITSRRKMQSTENTSFSDAISTAQIKENEPQPEKGNDLIPPQNQTATTVDEIYNIYDFISEKEYHALDSEITLFTNASREDINQWKNEDKYCKFITNYLENRCSSISVHNAKLLCYLHYMMCFSKKSYKDWKKKDPVPEVPTLYRNCLMDRYLINRSMPKRKKDKLIVDSMLLMLFLSNYMLDANLLASSTCTSVKRLGEIAHAIGCYVHEKKGEQKKIIELKLPLFKFVPKTFKRKS